MVHVALIEASVLLVRKMCDQNLCNLIMAELCSSVLFPLLGMATEGLLTPFSDYPTYSRYATASFLEDKHQFKCADEQVLWLF